MIFAKQSTAVTVSFGPFVLNSDGVTLVTNLTGTGSNQTENTSTGIRISKNGAAFIARHATAGASTYDAFGNYLVPLDTTDTNTLGVLRMQYANAAAFCPMFIDIMVMPANMWNSMFATGGSIPDAVAGAAGGVFIAGTNAAVTVTGATVLTGNVSVAAGLTVTQSTSNGSGISVTGNGTGHGIISTSGSGATGNGIRATAASTNGSGIRCDGTGTGDGMNFNGGATGHGIETIGGATSGDGIKVATTSGHGMNLAPAGSNKHGIFATGGDAGTSNGMTLVAGTGGVALVAANLSVPGDVWDVTLASHLTSGTTGASLNSASSAGDPWSIALPGVYSAGTAGYTLGNSLHIIRANTATAGAATTITLDGSASAVDSFYKGDILYLSGGTGSGQARFITGYVGSTKVATVSTWATNPDNTSTFVITPFDAVATSAPTTAQIATAVWQDATAGDFTTSSSIGKSLYTTGVAPGAAGGMFIAGTNAATTITTALTTTFTGNLTGSAGSVTGAVGSVTGAVGSVTGAVGSVTGTVGSVTGNVGGNVTGSVGSVVGIAVKKNTALANFPILMVLAVDHVTPATGLTVAVQRSIDGGAFANATNTPATEISAGLYKISLSAADLNGATIVVKATSATADQRTIVIVTEL